MPSEKQNNSSRKLAAILFADIVGYTAMMQSDEDQTMSRLQRYQEVLNMEVSQHNGEIIKNYGDGSLCLFSSVLDAVHCAKAVQEALGKEPKVPLRIGLHLGDVMYRENDIYGNAINVASRIESMGIPGSVLMSKDIQKKINNQSDLSTQFLGTFEFKNVEETMEVFALANEGFALPKKGEVQGKFKSIKKSWLKPALFSVSLLLALGFWMYSSYGDKNQLILNEDKSSPTGTPLPSNVLSQRVAVVPFQNNTNDPEQDILGRMAADWINRGLMEIETAEVVSPSTVSQNLHALGILPNNPDKKTSFSELTGARNFVQGTFYKEKEELIFLVELVDAIDGKIKFKFPRIRENIDDKEDLITRLRELISGYWAARDMVDSHRIKAPKYEAYQSFLNALQDADLPFESLVNSFTLDSTFYLARIHFLLGNRGGVYGSNKTHFEFLERHKDKLSEYELGWYNSLKGLYSSNFQLAYSSLDRLRRKYPKDFILNNETAGIAGDAFNNPELQLEIYDQLPMEQVKASFVDHNYSIRIWQQIISFIKLKRTAELNDFIRKIESNRISGYMWYDEAFLYEALFSKNQDRIDKAYQQFKNGINKENFTFYLWRTLELERSVLSKPLHNQIQKDVITWYHQFELGIENQILYQNIIARLEGKINNLNTNDFEDLPNSVIISHLYNAAVAFIDAGRKNEAYPFIDRLKTLTINDFEVSSDFGSSFAYYSMGVLYTKLGQIEDAIYNLEMARKGGFGASLSRFQYDKELALLFGMPAFEELTKPIWPEVKD